MKNTRNLILTAMFIAIGVVLPQAFHMIPNAGSVVLPMHIPVLIAGFAVGPLLGAICGFFTPLLSHLIFGMPPAMVLPSMLCELTVYGLMTGLLDPEENFQKYIDELKANGIQNIIDETQRQLDAWLQENK